MAIENLTDELLAEILYHLPLVSLLQCKFVSKRFRRMISDPHFHHPHPIHHQLLPRAFETHASFMFFHFNSGSNFDKMILLSNNKTHILRGSDFFPHIWPQDCSRVRVKATHYDLVLSSTHNQSFTHYFVCNPFTKQYVALPPIPKSQAPEVARVGFIYDQSQSRFRVMHIPVNCFEYVSSFQVNVFSSETGEWGSFNVVIPHRKTLMSNSCSRKILAYNDKFVLWMKDYGFFVYDSFNGGDSRWQIILMPKPRGYLDDFKTTWDLYSGTCNGTIKVFAFSRTSPVSIVYELKNLERGTWLSKLFHSVGGTTSMSNMNFLAFHPQCESMIYFYTKKDIFLCDYTNRKLESVYTPPSDEDVCVSDSVMSLFLPKWPTVVPALKEAVPKKLQE